jgi:hypothetical protein
MLLIKRFLNSTIVNLHPTILCNVCDRIIYCYDCKKFISCNNCNDNLFYRPCKKLYCNNYCGGVYEDDENE